MICERANIELAVEKSLKGKKTRRQQRRFLKNREALTDLVEENLKNEIYQFGKLHSFPVYEPKKRDIDCPDYYPDRIYHHAVMNVVVPMFIKKMTADTCGSIEGRGIEYCRKRVERAIRNRKNAYYLKIDIRKFYQSIDHDVCKEAVRRITKCAKTLRILDAIIDRHDEGLAIGVYPSQYLANLTLCRFDHWVKEQLHVEDYFRYMDDMVFFCSDKHEAHRLLELINKEISDLKLTIKANVRIAPCEKGLDFVGYVFYPTHTLVRKRVKQHWKKKCRWLLKNNADDRTIKTTLAPNFGHIKHANSVHLINVTLGEKAHVMYERLSDLKSFFSLPRERWVSITELVGKDIIIFDYKLFHKDGEEKVAFLFAYPEDEETKFYSITASRVIKDRLQKNAENIHKPYIVTVYQKPGRYNNPYYGIK